MWYVVPADNNECGAGHDCEDLCVNTDGGYECRCSEGTVLASDGRSCVGGCCHKTLQQN